MNSRSVLILMGSESDKPLMQPASDILTKFGVRHMMTVASAHRSPVKVARLVKDAETKGVAVIIAGAGMAAHLAGAVAARTTLPVIGVPLASGALNGLDALLATVQMPSGVPVATMAINGAKNAAYLAVQILALADKRLAKALKAEKTK
ncbi:MAG: 5-(carboxyamino)imidazole ribonucleotide mutase [Planctomycetota bacterium]|nr:5-(carboxyamino)imidazole ribonucleotide mutase [Planctomycetota bacterium]